MSQAAPATSNLAIASLLFSSLSVVLWPFGFIPGIVLGMMARRQIAADPSLGGRGIATAGIVVGIGFLIVGLLLLALGILIVFSTGSEISPFIYTLE